MPVDVRLVVSRSPHQLLGKRFGLDSRILLFSMCFKSLLILKITIANAAVHCVVNTSRADVKTVTLSPLLQRDGP